MPTINQLVRKSREDKVSEFKLYLIRHKDKFKINLNEILEMI